MDHLDVNLSRNLLTTSASRSSDYTLIEHKTINNTTASAVGERLEEESCLVQSRLFSSTSVGVSNSTSTAYGRNRRTVNSKSTGRSPARCATFFYDGPRMGDRGGDVTVGA